jgi:tetratricopeptide (TPR) repeat protein
LKYRSVRLFHEPVTNEEYDGKHQEKTQSQNGETQTPKTSKGGSPQEGMMPLTASLRFFLSRAGHRLFLRIRPASRILAVSLIGASGCARWPLSKQNDSTVRIEETRAEAAAFYARGLSFEWTGEPEPALACYRSAHALDRTEPLILERLISVLSVLDRPEEAVAALETACRATPGSAGIQALTGRYQISLKNWDSAAAAFQRAITLEPGNPDWILSLVFALEGAGRDDEAADYLRAASNAGAETGAILKSAGRMAARNRSEATSRKAVALIQDLVPLDSGSAGDLLLAYEMVDRAGESGLAGSYLDRLAEIQPDNNGVKLQLALGLLHAGNRARARALLEELVGTAESDPGDVLRLIAAMSVEETRQDVPPEAVRAAREGAVHALQRLLQQEPNAAAAAADLISQLLMLQRVEDALTVLETFHPEHPGIQREFARLFSDSEGKAEVRAVLDRRVAAQPGRASVFYVLGELELLAGRPAQAADNFEQAAQADPPSHAAISSWCEAALRRDRKADVARTILQKSLERNPRDALLLELRANLEQIDRHPEEAADWIERAAAEAGASGPLPPEFELKRAVFLAFAGRVQAARDILIRTLDGNSTLQESLAAYGAAWTEVVKDPEPVRALFAIASKTGPDDSFIPLCAGMFEALLDHPDRAALLYGRALQMAAESDPPPEWVQAPFYFLYGAACEQAGYPDQAVVLLKQCVEMDPQHAPALNYLAYFWADRSMELDRALEYVQRALEQDPESGAYIDTLAWIHYRQGFFEKAQDVIQRALTQEPSEAEILDHAGDICEALNQSDTALAYWRKAFILNPTRPGLREKLLNRKMDLDPLQKEADARSPDPEPDENDMLFDLTLGGLNPIPALSGNRIAPDAEPDAK